jgi:hypothetical protein
LLKKTLLLTARDYNTGINAYVLANSEEINTSFNVKVAVDIPSTRIFKSSNRHYEIIDCKGCYSSDSKEFNKTILRAKNFLKNVKPDVLLTGVTGEGIAIDEIAVSIFKGKIPTFSYQDYWGYLNQTLGDIADKILLMDEAASLATSNKYPNVETEIVGSLKYDYIKNHKRTHLKAKYTHTEKNRNQEYWVFIGQPLHQLQTYLDTVNFLDHESKKRHIPCYYIPHPAEKFQHIQNKIPLSMKCVPSESIEKDLFTLGSSKIFSCFSTYSMEILMMKKVLATTSPDIAFLDFHDEINNYRKSFDGSSMVFPISKNFIGIVKNVDEFDAFLNREPLSCKNLEFASSTSSIANIIRSKFN